MNTSWMTTRGGVGNTGYVALLIFVALIMVLMAKWRAPPYRTMARGYLAGGVGILVLVLLDGAVWTLDMVWEERERDSYHSYCKVRAFQGGSMWDYCRPIQNYAQFALIIGAVAGVVLIAAGVLLQRRRWRTKILIASGIAAAVVITTLVVNLVAGRNAPSALRPEELPFTSLNSPTGVAVYRDNVYVADSGNNRVLKLDYRSTTPIVLPFTGLNSPTGVAVYRDNVYVADSGNNRVLELTPYSTTPIVLPFIGLNRPTGVAVDSLNVYVTDSGNNRVLSLGSSGSSSQVELAFGNMTNTTGMALSTDVYVIDGNRVLQLPKDASNPLQGA